MYNVGQITLQTHYKIKKRNGTLGLGSKATQLNTAPVTHSSHKSLPHNPELDNVNNNQSELTFIDDYDNEISDFDEYAEYYERPRNKVYANIKMPESDNPSVSSADSSLYTREPFKTAR